MAFIRNDDSSLAAFCFKQLLQRFSSKILHWHLLLVSMTLLLACFYLKFSSFQPSTRFHKYLFLSTLNQQFFSQTIHPRSVNPSFPSRFFFIADFKYIPQTGRNNPFPFCVQQFYDFFRSSQQSTPEDTQAIQHFAFDYFLRTRQHCTTDDRVNSILLSFLCFFFTKGRLSCVAVQQNFSAQILLRVAKQSIWF